MLTRKLKVKYIDNNPAFFNDAWANFYRENMHEVANRSFMSGFKSKSNLFKGSNKKVNNNVTFGASLPDIRGKMQGKEQTRNSML